MKKQLRASDIALMGMMIATLEVAKYALSFLPNVELVTLLIILYTLYFGNKMPYVLGGLCIFGRLLVWVWSLVDHVSVCVAAFGGHHLSAAQTAVSLDVFDFIGCFRADVRSALFAGLPVCGRTGRLLLPGGSQVSHTI